MAMAEPNGEVGAMVIKGFSFFYVESSTRSTGNGDDNNTTNNNLITSATHQQLQCRDRGRLFSTPLQPPCNGGAAVTATCCCEEFEACGP